MTKETQQFEHARKVTFVVQTVTLAVLIVTLLGLLAGAFLYVFQIRADFDSFVAAHIQHEKNCESEREHLQVSIQELKNGIDRLHIELESLKSINHRPRYYNENSLDLYPSSGDRFSLRVQ